MPIYEFPGFCLDSDLEFQVLKNNLGPTLCNEKENLVFSFMTNSLYFGTPKSGFFDEISGRNIVECSVKQGNRKYVLSYNKREKFFKLKTENLQ
jgi:hypothetical protein